MSGPEPADAGSGQLARRDFMAKASIWVGSAVGVTLAVPLVTSLLPESSGGASSWSALTSEDGKAMAAATEHPIKLTLRLRSKDGYLPEKDSDDFVWGIKVPPGAAEARFRSARKDLFDEPGGNVAYPVLNLSFAIFSPLCPHLGCRYNYVPEQRRFICPCHGSQYDDSTGAHVAGPAQRGLDPLPLRAKDGVVQVTWIEYRPSQPSRVILAFG